MVNKNSTQALLNMADLFEDTNILYKEGSFWTTKQRQGHSLHEISYRACFKPQLVEYFIDTLTKEGDTVLDPFMGRGTTVLQALLDNRNAYGSDINPLAKMLVEPRLLPPKIIDINNRLNLIPKHTEVPEDCSDLLVFFHKDTLSQLVAMKHWFANRIRNGQFDKIDNWIRMVVMNRLTGHSNGFLSVTTMPPNQTVSIEAQRKINEKYNRSPYKKDVSDVVLRKSKSLMRSGEIYSKTKHKVCCCDASNLKYAQRGEIDLILTSPPFLDVVDYAKDNWLRCWFGNIDIDKVKMAIYKKPTDWTCFISKVFNEFARVVRRGGYVAFEVGEVKNGKIKLEKLVLQAMKGLPFKLEEILINKHNFTKTANCWGVENNQKGTLTNRIIVSKRI